MRALIEKAIRLECDKHIRRHFEYLLDLDRYAARRSAREGRQFQKQILLRPWWRVADAFNPFRVRRDKKLRAYSHALARRLRARTYRPKPALLHSVPKVDGTMRSVNIFQLPDAAVSTLVYKSLIRKNSGLLSSYSYAYREDRTPHDAVRSMFLEWRGLGRAYVAEYDFRHFFDEIDHDHLLRALTSHGLIIGPEEMHVIREFLQAPAAARSAYPGDGKPRNRGIPQGASISLFLANVACWDLDRALERLGVGFSRYADDTVIWSDDYGKIVQAYSTLSVHASRMGVPINPIKSHGICVLNSVGKPEIASRRYVEYLGYRISLRDVAISARKEAKLKSRISFLIYQNLIQQLRKGCFNRQRLTTRTDLDYLTTLNQIRFFLYGGLTEDKLRRYLAGRAARLNFRGAMSYYPVVTDTAQLARMDGWLRHSLRAALRLRQRLWAAAGVSALPGPGPAWIEDIDKIRTLANGSGADVDARVPSFTLIHAAMRLAIEREGVAAVANPNSFYYG